MASEAAIALLDRRRPARAGRDRLAAELHAIVAAALADVGDRASVARTLLGVDDAAAAEHLAAVPELALGALDELRRLLAALADAGWTAAERAGVARDVHDVVGHGLSLAGVLAGAAAAVLPRDRDAARRSLAQLQATVEETRRELAGLLHPREPGAGCRVPSPDAGDLLALVARAAAAGQPVRLSIEGGPLGGVAARVLASAHRIVQEALTNARKHATGAAVDVRIAVGEDAVAVEVVNARAAVVRALPAGGCGRGIAGMRQRAALLGGELHAAPTPAGGFRVAARLPR
ncbi:MAG TPA: histidine kinase [Capillimicrobium sp.]|nr:histidine kinase [Capillimicrobium sp.]